LARHGRGDLGTGCFVLYDVDDLGHTDKIVISISSSHNRRLSKVVSLAVEHLKKSEAAEPLIVRNFTLFFLFF
jgi:hypothetical protein